MGWIHLHFFKIIFTSKTRNFHGCLRVWYGEDQAHVNFEIKNCFLSINLLFFSLTSTPHPQNIRLLTKFHPVNIIFHWLSDWKVNFVGRNDTLCISTDIGQHIVILIYLNFMSILILHKKPTSLHTRASFSKLSSTTRTMIQIKFLAYRRGTE